MGADINIGGLMFKKNPQRPRMVVDLKRVPTGYKVAVSESSNLFQIKRVTRTMYRRTLFSTQPISFKPQTWDYRRKALPFPALSSSHPPTSLSLPLQAGSDSMPFTPSNASSSLSSSPRLQKAFPSVGRTSNFTGTTETRWWGCGGKT